MSTATMPVSTGDVGSGSHDGEETTDFWKIAVEQAAGNVEEEDQKISTEVQTPQVLNSGSDDLLSSPASTTPQPQEEEETTMAMAPSQSDSRQPKNQLMPAAPAPTQQTAAPASPPPIPQAPKGPVLKALGELKRRKVEIATRQAELEQEIASLTQEAQDLNEDLRSALAEIHDLLENL